MNQILAHLCLLAFLFCAPSLLAQAPTIVETTPKSGDTAVPTTLTELRITFDRDMASGFSFTGGGETFPELAGKPRWLNKRTCILPVKLAPGREYRIGINSSRATNFKSAADNTPVVPWLWTFTTAGTPATQPAEQIEKNRAALTELARLLREDYSYADRKGIDWPAALERARPDLEQASPESFARKLAALLAPAEDIHIRVGLGDNLSQIYRPNTKPNCDPSRLPALIPNWKPLSKTAATGTFPDGTVYLTLASWSAPDDIAAANALIDTADRIILDVRLNGGGDELLARSLAGRFTNKPVLYAKHRTLSKGTWSDIQERWLQPAGTYNPARKVIVLQGPANFSSNESFLQMMLATGATTLGQTTGGSSGNPKRHDLGNGISLSLPSWQALLPDGSPLEGLGLKPTLEVPFTGDGDPLITKALELLQTK